jgi:hypothetical protein
MKVKGNERWLNKNDKASPPRLFGKDNGNFGHIYSEESRNRMSQMRSRKSVVKEEVGSL